jgi:MFS family permease
MSSPPTSPAATPTRAIHGSVAASDAGARRGRVRPWRRLVLCCLGLAALSLLTPSSPTYDPWAWLLWGREITHWDLTTTSGPSWKPLPVIFTTPLSLLGDDLAPLAWLIVARAGGLLALALAYRLASRLAGAAAGIIAVVGLLLANHLVSFTARGTSEGLQVALVLWAIERHLDGRRLDAFAFGLAAGLLRPELWPFIGLYGLWLALSDLRATGSWRSAALVTGGFVALGLLWFVPEYVGSGDLLRAASRARVPVPDSPALSDHPFLAVFTNGSSALSWPVYTGALIAVAAAVASYRRERRGTAVLALAALAAGLMIAVAALAQNGFTGNIRYVLLPASLVCVLAGVGWAQLVRAARGRFDARAAGAVAAVALAVAVPFIVHDTGRLYDQLASSRREVRQNRDLPTAIANAGGRSAMLRCGGNVWTGPFATPIVAWYLHVHQHVVGFQQRPPGMTIVLRGARAARDPRFARIASSRLWIVGSSCARRD